MTNYRLKSAVDFSLVFKILNLCGFGIVINAAAN
ncbi:hypothetical protein LAZ26_01145 [Haemophilus influenzae]|nr:hypothetical protein [Haemophilus influenzae]UEB32550.1 hypothetical protein LK401_06275 [Haemophilus influenzae]